MKKNGTKTQQISVPARQGAAPNSVLVTDLTGQARPQSAPIAVHGRSTCDEHFSSFGAANQGHGG
jgi:hypothetical protein